MTSDDVSPSLGSIDAVAERCGCAGKTSLERVVRPALADVRAELAADGIKVAGDLEAGLLPNTASLEQSVVGEKGREDGDHPWRYLTAVFADVRTGSDPERFRHMLVEKYRSLAATHDGTESVGADVRRTIVKGHSAQLEGADESVVWSERLRPVGNRRPGYRLANIDVIHAFPALRPQQQAAIAVCHALNDCYAGGAHKERTIRPVVAVPSSSAVTRERVSSWFRPSTPAGVTLHEPAVITHDGRGWLFGATATAVTGQTPPVHTGAIEPGDAVVIHRPLGGLALYAGGTDADDLSVRKRALEALTADHAPVAEAVAASRPHPDERFDPDRHLKWVGDVSGPGLDGIVHATGFADCGIHLESLPLIERETLAEIRKRWVVPDVTVETNGPLAVIGRPTAIEQFRQRLKDIPTADPGRIGRVTDAAEELTWSESVDLEWYVERMARRKPT